MKASNVLNAIGVTILLLSFVWATQRSLRISAAKVDSDRVTIRFAHWQLEGGIREAFDAIARDYEKLHPGVYIEQVAVPERIFPQWVNTQLVGETITDLVALSGGKGGTDEIVARHFIPLTDYVEQPNPYNKGTPLEGIRLRDTFIDGMTGNDSFRVNLLEYYGLPLSAFTVRMYYNRNLWRSIFGDTPPPADYDEFLKLCADVHAFSKSSGRPILPIAGSKDNAPFIIENLFSTIIQRLNQSLDTLLTLQPTAAEISIDYLRGDWSLETPAIRAGFEISREAGLNFQPGYTQLGRDDASFYFVQSKALMITTGSWDSTSFRKLANFEIGVFDLPIPSSQNPKYGAYLLGPAAEGASTGLSFAIPRHTKHFDQTLDFLLYLGSQPVNEKFSRISGWLPSVVGVKPDAQIAPFFPRDKGYVNGFPLEKLGADTKRIMETSNNLLVSPNGSVDLMLTKLRKELAATLRSDLDRAQRSATQNISRQDINLAGLQRQPNASFAKIDQTLESQNRREAAHGWLALELHRTSAAASAAK
jgi:raffinose/stachyose/melibiose transport system substrate-binding protein